MKRKGNSKELLNIKDVDRWYHNVARGAEVTADTYLRRLRAFCEWASMDPMKLADMVEEDLFNLLLDFVTYEEKRGKAGSYIESSIKAVKSWLNHKGKHIARKIKVRDATRTPTLVDERVPTQEELKKIFLSATKRDRVACAIMAHSGTRPEVLGNYRGNDGLTIRDFPELKIENGSIEFEKIPTIIMIRPELSKTNLRYFTFLSEEGCGYLQDYLEERIRKGEKLEPGTDIITSRNTNKRFIRALNIGDAIRNSIRRGGFGWRPYVLRAYCDTQLLLAESKGKMVHSYRQFVMGHKGDIEARYTVNKSKLPEDLIEDMRESYRRSQEFLQTTTLSNGDNDDFDKTFKKRMLSLIGINPEEITEDELEEMNDGDIMDEFKKRLGNGGNGNGNSTQKVIDIEEAQKYIESGWEYVNTLPGNKMIVKTHNLE